MKLLLLLLAAAAAGFGQTYTGSFLNLLTPISGMEEGDFEFSMNHRFFGAALKDEPLETFFGLDNGANVRFGGRYYMRADIYVAAYHERLLNRNSILAGWSSAPAPYLQTALEAGYSSLKPTGSDDREGGMVASGCLALIAMGGRLRPVINYAWDGYREDSGFGLGLEFMAAERLAVFGEYFPADDDGGPEDCFAFGSRYNSWGHQFLLGLSNSAGIGTYELMQGSGTKDLSVSLSIRRRF